MAESGHKHNPLSHSGPEPLQGQETLDLGGQMTEVKREVVERKAYRWGLTREEFELRQAQIEKRRAETDEAQLFDLYARALFPFVLAPEPPDGHSDSAIPE